MQPMSSHSLFPTRLIPSGSQPSKAALVPILPTNTDGRGSHSWAVKPHKHTHRLRCLCICLALCTRRLSSSTRRVVSKPRPSRNPQHPSPLAHIPSSFPSRTRLASCARVRPCPACRRGYPSRPLTWPTWAQPPSRLSGSPEALMASQGSLQAPVAPQRCHVCHACPRSSRQAVVYASALYFLHASILKEEQRVPPETRLRRCGRFACSLAAASPCLVSYHGLAFLCPMVALSRARSLSALPSMTNPRQSRQFGGSLTVV